MKKSISFRSLYEILETEPSIKNALRFEFSSDTSSTLNIQKAQQERKPLLEKSYEELVKPKLIEMMIEKQLGTKNLLVNEIF